MRLVIRVLIRQKVTARVMKDKPRSDEEDDERGAGHQYHHAKVGFTAFVFRVGFIGRWIRHIWLDAGGGAARFPGRTASRTVGFWLRAAGFQGLAGVAGVGAGAVVLPSTHLSYQLNQRW